MTATDPDPTAPTAESRPRAVPGAAWVEVDGEVVVHDPASRRVARLDRVAGLVWPFFDGTASIGELAVDVAVAFGQPEHEVTAALVDLVGELAGVGLVTLDGAPAERPAPRSGYLVDPPGPCGGGGGRPDWAPTRTIAIEGVRIGVRTVPELEGALDAVLAPFRVEDDPDITPNYSLQPARPDRRFHVVVRYLCDAVRARDPQRAVRGLVAHLGGHRRSDPSLLRTSCTAVLLPDDRAVLLPNLVGVIGRVQRQLEAAGARLIDTPWSDVDVSTRSLVVPDPDPGFDGAALADLVEALRSAAPAPGPSEPVVAPGRYALAGWVLEAFVPEGADALPTPQAVEHATRLVAADPASPEHALRATATILEAIAPTVVRWDDRRALVATVRGMASSTAGSDH